MNDQPKTPAGWSWSGLVGVAAAIASIAAGIYLFQTESASEDATVFDALFKGLGGYMVARGMWMLASLGRTSS